MFRYNNFLDPAIDKLDPQAREEWLQSLLLEQIRWAIDHETPWIIKKIKGLGLTINDFKKIDDRFKLGPFTKRNFRENGTRDLLPDHTRYSFDHGGAGLYPFERVALTRGAGGTTVKSVKDYTFVIWAQADWTAAMQASTRGILEDNSLIRLPARSATNYTIDHVAQPFFSSVIIFNGGTYFPRHVNVSNQEFFEMLVNEQCDGIISPPGTHLLKGKGLDELILYDWNLDKPYITKEKIKLVIVSSTPLSKELFEEFQKRRIPIKDGGGSTDIGAALWNCTADPLRWHAVEGAVYVEVWDRNTQRPAEYGQKGLLVASRIAGVIENEEFRRRYQLLYHVENILDQSGQEIPEFVHSRATEICGENILSIPQSKVQSYRVQAYQEYLDSCKIVPNQGSQLIQYSGLMNESTWFTPEECGCGKNAKKFQGLERSYDFDGNPDDLIQDQNVDSTNRDEVSTIKLQLPDGCAVSNI